MTLLPVLLTTWDYIGLNGVENLSFCLSLALDHQIEYQICFVFLALSVCALVFSFSLTSLYVAISILLSSSF